MVLAGSVYALHFLLVGQAAYPRGSGRGNGRSFEYLVKRLVPAWEGVRFSGFWPAVHHGVIFVGANILAGEIRHGGEEGWLAVVYQNHTYLHVFGLLELLDFNPYLGWEVYALVGILQTLVFAIFSLTPLCRDPWANRVWPTAAVQQPLSSL